MVFPRLDRDRTVDRRTLWNLWIIGGTLLLVLWVPLLTHLDFPQKGDEASFHVPNVIRFTDHFPSLREMRDTDLSMLPLFHGFLGFLLRITGGGIHAMRFFMMLIGLSALFLYLRIARRIPGIEGAKAAPLLVAFPYFGVCYFVVITDHAAFLALSGAVLGQLAYLGGRRNRAAYVAGLAGAAACLIRQNAIFAAAVFPLVLWLHDQGWFGPGSPREDSPASPDRRLLRPAILPALLLPFLGLAFQLWLWKGVIPPSFMSRPRYFDSRTDTALLSFFSVAANVGYYLLPATLTYAFLAARSFARATWAAVAVPTLFGLFWCYHLRGLDLVGTYGTFRHLLSFLSYRVGLVPGLGVLGLSLASFFILLTAGIRRTWRFRSPEAVLLGLLLLAAHLVTSYGLFRIYERHILPVYAFAALFFLTAAPDVDRRRFTWGWMAAVAFGAAHGVVYAVNVYELFR